MLIGIDKIVFSPDGAYALSNDLHRALHLWDVTSGQDISPFAEAEVSIGYQGGVAFSPDGSTAVVGDTECPQGREVAAVPGVNGTDR